MTRAFGGGTVTTGHRMSSSIRMARQRPRWRLSPRHHRLLRPPTALRPRLSTPHPSSNRPQSRPFFRRRRRLNRQLPRRPRLNRSFLNRSFLNRSFPNRSFLNRSFPNRPFPRVPTPPRPRLRIPCPSRISRPWDNRCLPRLHPDRLRPDLPRPPRGHRHPQRSPRRCRRLFPDRRRR
jgi:hypothetical protein